jgi:ATP-dependent helicase/nuclease subunit A
MTLIDTPRDAATQRQVDAANPRNSTWLSANAGSGKTRVLTDRVARLLLDGLDPQNILCLTYTKAAASEMQNRLFKRLGAWAMMDGDGLARDLSALGVAGGISPDRLREARTLFARAIETPGGLKIQTIHSFCAGLLRRFPLEAGVSPQFTEMEDRAAQLLRAEVVDEMASGAQAGLVDALARRFTGEDLGKLLAEMTSKRDAFVSAPDDAALCDMFDLPPDLCRDDALKLALQPGDAAIAKALCEVLTTQSATYQKFAEALGPVDCDLPDWAGYNTLCDLFLYKSGENQGRSKSINFPQASHKKVVEAVAHMIEDVHGWMDRVEAAQSMLHALSALDRTRALYAFAGAFVPAYEDRKLRRGMLDFDDLIRKARALLTDPHVAAWVLFRLDGGIDHILVDEAQDTSPDQWAVVERLTQEFAAGEGSHPERQRTIFVVGDKKQSIYSFQGADPEAFDEMRDHFATELVKAGPSLHALSLEHSFRSSAAILRVVDSTFTEEHREGLGDEVFHLPFKDRLPGRVDLWPAIEKSEDSDEGREWTDPVDRPGEKHHSVLLAERIADAVKRMVETDTIPAATEEKGYAQRRISEGDILILVQRRSELFSEIIRACKERGLRVAGADRLKVGAELAVRDIAALLSFLALPEDDLSLAAALKSPLFGWTEQQLYTLAQGREQGAYLWASLRAASAAHPDTLSVLDDLRRQADFLRPYDLIERILTRHRGRKNLLGRLGTEAEDGIDALLSQALAYERSEVPSLTGFLGWMETDALEIKRQMDSAGDRIRVMTVHGAKGLEAPIVILPDTAKRPVRINEELLRSGDRVVWKTAAATMPPSMRALRDKAIAAQERERRRLLYVAMTRAETWLIVCGAGETGEGGDSWYGMVDNGIRAAGAGLHPFTFGDGLRLDYLGWAGLPVVEKAALPKLETVLPRFAEVAAPPRAPVPPSPSDLGGAKIIGDADEGDAEVALANGRLVHLLLEHLPDLAVQDRPRIGRALMAGADDAPLVTDTDRLVDDVCRMIVSPDLADIFNPAALAEVEITATLNGTRMHGVIDRLLIDADRILAIDFKTNRIVPEQPDRVPEGLLRQMGAYHALLAEVYPGRRIDTAILWTHTGRLMPLPEDMVSDALARVTVP